MKKNKPVIKYSNYFTSTVSLFFLVIIHLFFSSIYLKIGYSVLVTFFWLSYFLRIFYLYEDKFVVYFPLRIKIFYKKRKQVFSYIDMENLVIMSGKGVELKFVLKKKRKHFFKLKNDYFTIIPDSRASGFKGLVAFMRRKGVKVILKTRMNERYLFEPDNDC